MSDEKKTVLSMRHINKTFPGVKALSDAQLTLREGEIHALMGENGAGKSTLIKVLTGVEEFETWMEKVLLTHPLKKRETMESAPFIRK